VRVEGVLPYWLDRPDEEALEVALQCELAGLQAVWVGEMATYDAPALATAIGHRSEQLALRLGPLAVGVRSPVAIALAASSVAGITAHRVDLALGASSPGIVAGWHDRSWSRLARRTEETVECLRLILAGERVSYDGQLIHSHGFRLRHPLPDAHIWVAAFGPKMTRLAARIADGVLLNLVSPDRVASVRQAVEAVAEQVGRPPPPLAVWVPVAVEPGEAARAQLAGQLAVYLAPPGYGEMFSELGFSALVERARAGAGRAELAAEIPIELVEQVGAIGTVAQIADRLAAYQAAGADVVGVVPSTAEDAGGGRVLGVLSKGSSGP
jgi:probable F420-dependent oxidoreductase